MQSINWATLVEREPELNSLLEETKDLRPSRKIREGREVSYFCNVHARGFWGPRLTRLCGVVADTTDHILKTPEAYSCAASILRWAAPPCQNCKHDLLKDREAANV